MTYKVTHLSDGTVASWTLAEVLEEINRDRSEEWIDYDATDWREGWAEWVEGEFYSLAVE